jgi:hypothetical protein
MRDRVRAAGRESRMRIVVFVAMAVALAGCGEASESKTTMTVPETSGRATPASAPAAPADRAARGPGEETKAATAGRKIIYNARVDLVTEDLSAFESKLRRLVAASNGYVADSEVSGKAGVRRDATWKVRVPVDAYDAFLEGAKSLGEMVSVKADAQDVTEEYFDLEARLANKKVEEQRLIKLLTDATGKLEEILKVEHELSRVREEVERFQGRIRALANLTSLTTVTISAREVHDYEPPQAPTFSTRIARTFAGSVDSLRQFGEGVVLFSVGIVPWIPVAAVVAIPVFIARRRIRRWLTTPMTLSR